MAEKEMVLRLSIPFAMVALVSAPVLAQEDRVVRDPVEVSKIVHSIRAFQGDLGSRLSAGGMGVESIRLHKMTREDVAEDPLHLALGDMELRVVTSGEPSAAGCKILGSPTFIKRGGRYMPQDRTGVWLLTGKCALPG